MLNAKTCHTFRMQSLYVLTCTLVSTVTHKTAVTHSDRQTDRGSMAQRLCSHWVWRIHNADLTGHK